MGFNSSFHPGQPLEWITLIALVVLIGGVLYLLADCYRNRNKSG